MATTHVIVSQFMWSKTRFLVFAWLVLVPTTSHTEDQALVTDPVLVQDSEENWKLVRAHCTACHSSLILKNLRLSRRAWQDVIKRMQTDEGMWELGETEPKILDYLETYFGPDTESSSRPGRRALITPRNQSPQK